MKRVIRQSESELRSLRLDHQQKLIELNKEKNNLIADLNRQNETEKAMIKNQYQQKVDKLQEIINNERERSKINNNSIS